MDGGAALARALAARGAEPPAWVEWHRSLGSTNDRLKDLAREGAPEWTIVIAESQAGGRGREGRVWVSPPGGLYLSILLRPRRRPLTLLPLAAGLAVAEAAGEHGLQTVLKWPNDVLVSERQGAVSASGGRKLAGILCEAAGESGAEWVVVGIGVNVRISPTVPDLSGRIAWLAEAASGQPPDLASVAAAVQARLRVWYDALGSSPASVVEAWRRRALEWWGEPVVILTGEQTVSGRMAAVDEDGALLVETDGGRRRLLSGEVSRLRRG